MNVEKKATIKLNENELKKIVAEYISNTTEYKIKPEEVWFRLGSEEDEFGGRPTPCLKGCEINTKI